MKTGEDSLEKVRNILFSIKKQPAFSSVVCVWGEHRCRSHLHREGPIISLLSLLTDIFRNETHGKEKPCNCFQSSHETMHFKIKIKAANII